MTKTFLIDTDCFTDTNLFNYYFQTVSQNRQKKISRLVPMGAKRLSLGAGVALTAALHDLGLYGQDAEVQHNEKGKPFLKSNLAHISLSHSGHYAVASISTHEVGVDIETIKSIEDGVIKRVTTKNEQDQMAQRRNLKDFYRLWTAKECILKITGDGLGGGMENIDLHLDEDAISIVTAPIGKNFYFKEYNIPDFCLTVCSEANDFVPSLDKITL